MRRRRGLVHRQAPACAAHLGGVAAAGHAAVGGGLVCGGGVEGVAAVALRAVLRAEVVVAGAEGGARLQRHVGGRGAVVRQRPRVALVQHAAVVRPAADRRRLRARRRSVVQQIRICAQAPARAAQLGGVAVAHHVAVCGGGLIAGQSVAAVAFAAVFEAEVLEFAAEVAA